MSGETLKVSTSRNEVPVVVDDKQYVIRELNGADLAEWRKMDGSTVSVDESGRATLTGLNLKDPEIELLKLCLFDEEGKRVPVAVLRTWGSNALQQLFRAAQELSGLTKKDRDRLENEAKNS